MAGLSPPPGSLPATPLPHPAGMTTPTADECWARDMLAAPWRERRAWVSARNALLQTHLADLHRELGQVVDGALPPARALERIGHLRSALDQIERRLQGLLAVAAQASEERSDLRPSPGRDSFPVPNRSTR